MSYFALVCAWVLPWLMGFGLLLALGWPGPPASTAAGRGGRVALRLGYGFFVGTLLLTLWMRALSLLGVTFSWLSIGLPMLIVAATAFAWAAKRGALSWTLTRDVLAGVRPPPLPRWRALVWWLLLGWLALRLASLTAEAVWLPLYPWDAWVQWATKARVWYELGRIVPFVRADAWLAGATSAYFDAAPSYPATIPLMQVWSSVALGSWDDSAMNWPWPLTLLALSLAVYGALRDNGLPPLGALIGAWLLASLPLVDVQVALAGYADLMMGAMYALAALELYRWARDRDPRDAAFAALLAFCCPLIKIPGIVWALTLVPGVIVALLPRRGLKIVAVGFGVAALALLALGRSETTVILGYPLKLDFAPSWYALAQSYLFFANWHLLFYATVAMLLVGGRRLLAPPLAPLAMTGAAGLAFLFVIFAYGNASAWMMSDYTTINRATMHFAPFLVCLGMLLWKELTAAPVGMPQAVAAIADA
jgi:hypothetical protein